MLDSLEELYQKLDIAFDEEKRLCVELDEFLKSFANRAEAENTALKTIIPRIEEARKKRGQLLDELTEEVRVLLKNG